MLMYSRLMCVEHTNPVMFGDARKLSIRWKMPKLLMLTTPTNVSFLQELLRYCVKGTTRSVANIAETNRQKGIIGVAKFEIDFTMP